jgi:outer membrane scaffolding protein for murein synthesis (MipA/OmpV family)
MKHTKLISSCASLLALGVISSPAMAYEEISEVATSGQAGGFVGLGAAVGPDYEGGDDYEARIAPFGRYNWATGRYVSLGGTSGTERAARVKANVITKDQSNIWELGPLLQYRLERDDVDNNKVDKLNKADSATELGAFVGLNSGPWEAALAVASDVTSEHDGTLVYMNGGYNIPINDKFTMELGAHLTWASDDYMEEYFGVTGSESDKTGLEKYQASSGFKDFGFGVTGHYLFNKTWGLLGNVGYTRMINDAEDSPLVDDEGDENQYEAVLAVTYAF